MYLPREGHQRGVEGHGQQHVRAGNGGHGQDGDKVGDMPAVGDEGGHGEDDHAGDENAGEEHGKFELGARVSDKHV